MPRIDQPVLVPAEGGLAEVVQIAVAETEPTVEEIAAKLARPLAGFITERIAASHTPSEKDGAKIVRDVAEIFMALESGLLFIQHTLDRAAPRPDDATWGAKMKKLHMLHEYMKWRLPRVLMLPHMRVKPDPA